MLDYIQIQSNFSDLKVYAFLRDPFLRLVSLYFAPHRWIKIDPISQAMILMDEIFFSEDDFLSLVDFSLASWQFLTTSERYYIPPKNLITLDFKKFDKEINQIFMHKKNKFQVPKVNQSPFKKEIKKILSSKNLQNYVHKSHHVKDLEIINNFTY